MPPHIRFQPVVHPNPNLKIKAWLAKEKTTGLTLGCILWYAHWHQYSFHPAFNTVFEKTSLRDIASFCEEETKKRRAGWGKKME
jgi:hypothetical protein